MITGMNAEQLNSLPDVTPVLGCIEKIIDGRRIKVPVMTGCVGALFQKDDDGVFEDASGVRWLTGWSQGKHVKHKFMQ